MPQAIVTKYLGPTDHLGSRIKASCQAGSVVVPWDHTKSTNENHDLACRALAYKFNWHIWTGRWIGGDMPNSEKSHRCYVFFGRLTWD